MNRRVNYFFKRKNLNINSCDNLHAYWSTWIVYFIQHIIQLFSIYAVYLQVGFSVIGLRDYENLFLTFPLNMYQCTYRIIILFEIYFLYSIVSWGPICETDVQWSECLFTRQVIVSNFSNNSLKFSIFILFRECPIKIIHPRWNSSKLSGGVCSDLKAIADGVFNQVGNVCFLFAKRNFFIVLLCLKC